MCGLWLGQFDLFQHCRLSSVLCVQRLVFLRFLIEAITTERTGGRLANETSECKKSRNSVTQAIRSVQSRTMSRAAVLGADDRVTTTTNKKRKMSATKKAKRKLSSPDSASNRDDEPSTEPNATRSFAAGTHGSVASSGASNSDKSNNSNSDDDVEVEPVFAKTLDTKPEDADELGLTQLQCRLDVSLTRMEEAMPWLRMKTAGGSPAVRATFLAASAFHQSLDVMVRSLSERRNWVDGNECRRPRSCE